METSAMDPSLLLESHNFLLSRPNRIGVIKSDVPGIYHKLKMSRSSSF